MLMPVVARALGGNDLSIAILVMGRLGRTGPNGEPSNGFSSALTCTTIAVALSYAI